MTTTDRQVAIIGQGPRSATFIQPRNPVPQYIDVDDGDREVWAINGPYLPPRWTRLYQLHGLDHIARVDDDRRIREAMRLALTHPDRELIAPSHITAQPDRADREERVTWQDPEWADHAIPYPLETVRRSDRGTLYLTSSFAAAIAHAIVEGRESILLDGIQFHGTLQRWSPGEAWAVPCIEYQLGRAAYAGVEVLYPPNAGLFTGATTDRAAVYGFGGPGSL